MLTSDGLARFDASYIACIWPIRQEPCPRPVGQPGSKSSRPHSRLARQLSPRLVRSCLRRRLSSHAWHGQAPCEARSPRCIHDKETCAFGTNLAPSRCGPCAAAHTSHTSRHNERSSWTQHAARRKHQQMGSRQGLVKIRKSQRLSSRRKSARSSSRVPTSSHLCCVW